MNAFMGRLAALAGRCKKLLLGVAGGATGAGVTVVLDTLGIHVAGPVAAAIATALAGLAVAFGPANNPPTGQ